MQLFGYEIGTGEHTPAQGLRIKQIIPCGVSATFKAKSTQQTPLGGSKLPFTPNDFAGGDGTYATGTGIEMFNSLVGCDFEKINVTVGAVFIRVG
jgi:hypothetical protein